MKIIEKIILVALGIDDILLDKIFQRISNFFQRTTGLTCFFLAKIAIVASWSAMVIWIFTLPDLHYLLRILLAICSLIYLLIVWVHLNAYDEKEDALSSRVNVMNSSVITDFPIRMLAWFFLITTSISSEGRQPYLISSRYLRICLVFVVVYLYFASCTPLPPGKSRIRKWLESLGNMFSKKAQSYVLR